jgi:hypothetical protein
MWPVWAAVSALRFGLYALLAILQPLAVVFLAGLALLVTLTALLNLANPYLSRAHLVGMLLCAIGLFLALTLYHGALRWLGRF